MPNAYIVECVRTAGGSKDGRLREWHPITLGAAVIDALVDRTGIDGAHIDDVIVGCVSQVGSQSATSAGTWCSLPSSRATCSAEVHAGVYSNYKPH